MSKSKAGKSADKKSKRKAASARKKDTVKGSSRSTFGNPIRNLIICGAAFVVLGVAFILYSDVLQKYLGYAIGGLVALVGVLSILFYFIKKSVDGVYHSEFALGLIALAFGAYIALYTETSLFVILGVLVAVDGVMKLQYTLDLIRMHYRKWWLALLVSLIGIAIGVAFVLELLPTDYMIYGLAFAVNGVLDIVALIMIAVRNRRASKAAKLAAAASVVEPLHPLDESAPADSAPAEEEQPVLSVSEDEDLCPDIMPAEPELVAVEAVSDSAPVEQPEPPAADAVEECISDDSSSVPVEPMPDTNLEMPDAAAEESSDACETVSE